MSILNKFFQEQIRAHKIESKLRSNDSFEHEFATNHLLSP